MFNCTNEYNKGAGLAFGPNAQKALEIIGVGDALARVSQNTSLDPDRPYVVVTILLYSFLTLARRSIGIPSKLARQDMR